MHTKGGHFGYYANIVAKMRVSKPVVAILALFLQFLGFLVEISSPTPEKGGTRKQRTKISTTTTTPPRHGICLPGCARWPHPASI
jgi:hypothetical protein